MFIINVGGEGEIPGVLNQQPPGVLLPGWRSQSQQTIADLVASGHEFLICRNDALQFPDDSVDEVISFNVPVDKPSMLGPGVQTVEVMRILKPGGVWFLDGLLHHRKP